MEETANVSVREIVKARATRKGPSESVLQAGQSGSRKECPAVKRESKKSSRTGGEISLQADTMSNKKEEHKEVECR